MAPISRKKKKAIAAFILLMELLELDKKEKKKKKRSRKVWVRPWIARRQQEGCFHQVFYIIFLKFCTLLDLISYSNIGKLIVNSLWH